MNLSSKQKPKVSRTTIPTNSMLNVPSVSYHYVDSFQGSLSDEGNKFTSVDVGKAFFSSGPKWIEKLFALRNKIVSVFGLKTSGDFNDTEKQLANFNCAPGEQLGLFKVFDKTESEVILGEDDKHLNFRISLFLAEPADGIAHRDLTVSTTVVFNNWFGRLYFLPVRPFHKLIVPAMLKGIITKLEERNA